MHFRRDVAARPATQEQREALERFGVSFSEDITVIEASGLITAAVDRAELVSLKSALTRRRQELAEWVTRGLRIEGGVILWGQQYTVRRIGDTEFWVYEDSSPYYPEAIQDLYEPEEPARAVPTPGTILELWGEREAGRLARLRFTPAQGLVMNANFAAKPSLGTQVLLFLSRDENVGRKFSLYGIAVGLGLEKPEQTTTKLYGCLQNLSNKFSFIEKLSPSHFRLVVATVHWYVP